MAQIRFHTAFEIFLWKVILQIPITLMSQYCWILEHFWCTSIAWNCYLNGTQKWFSIIAQIIVYQHLGLNLHFFHYCYYHYSTFVILLVQYIILFKCKMNYYCVKEKKQFKWTVMGPLLALVCPCFRKNVIFTFKIASFLWSLDNFLLKNVVVFIFGNQILWKWRSFEKGVIFDLLFICFSQ